MADRIAQIQIQTQKRIARARGQTSSASYNDTIDEVSHDLASFSDQWNNRLVSLTSDLPDGTVDNTVDAFTDGLSGTTMYVEADATIVFRSAYYNTSRGRPNTIYEQLSDVYTQMSNMQEDLEEQIDDLVTEAANISISDAASIYQAVNVEDALNEVMVKVNSVAIAGIDLSAVAQHYWPAQDNVFDIGKYDKRMRTIYVGPGSLRVVSKTSDIGAPPDKHYTVGINAAGRLTFWDDTTEVLQLDQDGVYFPVGGDAPGNEKEVVYNWNGEFAATSVFAYDQTTGHLGVGINNPQERLHVKQDGVGEFGIRVENANTDLGATAQVELVAGASKKAAFAAMGNSDEVQFQALTNNLGYFTFHTQRGGSLEEWVRIQNDGNVGIGISPGSGATERLHVYNDYAGQAGITINNPNASGSANLNFKSGGTLKASIKTSTASAVLGFSAVTNDTGYMTWGTQTGSSFYTRMRLSNAGNLGIGFNTNASARLHIKSPAPTNISLAVQRASDTADIIWLRENAAGGGQLDIFNGAGSMHGIVFASSVLTNSLAIGTATNHPLVFGTNNVFPLLVLDTDGELMDLDTVGGLKRVREPRLANTLTPTGTTQTINWDLGESQTIDLESATGNVTLTLNNPVDGMSYVLKVIQDSTTPRNLVWPAEVKWQGGVTPTISIGANAVDIVSLYYDGTDFYADIGQNYS